MNQNECIEIIVKNGVLAIIIGFIITYILYATMYSVTGVELYLGFALLGAIYGFLFIKLVMFENDLDGIVTSAVFAFFGAFVSINLIFTSNLKIAMGSSMLSYQYCGVCMLFAAIVNLLRDKYMNINPLENFHLPKLSKKFGKLPTVFCPECGVEVNADNIICPECGYKFNYIFCPECGSKLDEDDAFCLECGFKIDEGTSNSCPNCGNKLNDDAKFCPECGEKLE